MTIYKSAINKPVTTILIFVAVLIFGTFSLSKLPIDQFPEMDIPYVSIMTTYPGANGMEIETNVTKILENSLNTVDGLKNITSQSKDNISIISLELKWGANIDESVNDVRSAIDMAYNRLPDGASRPMIFKFSTSMIPVLQYAVTAKDSYSGLDKIIEDKVINVLNKIDGIGNISLSGAPERHIYIDLDPSKLHSYNISIEQIGQAVAANNINLASGSVKMGKEQYQLRVQGEYAQSSDINGIVVANNFGKKVFLRDLATVRDTIKDVTLEEKINGKDGARLVIMKQTGANTVKICDAVTQQMVSIQKNLPPDIKFEIIRDGSENIKNSIDGLTEAVFFAFLFVMLVVLFFLGRWRATLIIVLTIPISLVTAFVYLMIAESSLNIISLSSLTVAIGLVVDDAIVVLENIMRHLQKGSRPREASIHGTNEVWISVIASALVIIAVFFPLTMLGGQAGIMFKELGWIVTITIIISTVVAVSLTPVLSYLLLRSKKIIVNENGEIQEVEVKVGWYEKYIISFLNKIDRAYSKLIAYCLNHKLVVCVLAIVIVFSTFVPACSGAIGFNFMQEEDNGFVTMSIELQRGTRVEESSKFARKIEGDLATIAPEMVLINSMVGASEDAGFASLFSPATNNKIAMNIRFPKKYERERSIFVIAENIRKYLDKQPEVINYSVSTQGGMGGGGGSTVDVEVYGYDFDQTNLAVEQIRQRVKNIKGARNITVSREEDRAGLQINFDKEKLSQLGLTTQQVSLMVRNRVNGLNAGYFKEDGDEHDIVVRLSEKFRNSITDIEEIAIPVATPTGYKSIKIKQLAEIQEFWTPPIIEHKNRQRYVKVSVYPVGISLVELAEKIQGEIDQLEMPSGVTTIIGGNYKDTKEMQVDMLSLGLLIILLVYVVMASQFESLSKPFIIMLGSIPFAFSGAFLALIITGQALDMVGSLGLILLVGIVVKNGIVLVDYINLMRDRGYELNTAITKASESRLRPVLMTSITMLLGMLPMALSTSEGSEMWVPLGIVVIGGLVFSTIVTLLVVPTLFAVFSKHGERDKIQKERQEYIFMDLK